MSAKNEDILDNWEEIDEIGLNSKLDKLKKDTAKMNFDASNAAMATSSTPSSLNGSKPMKILVMDDDYRAQYGPTEPKVKILRRPVNERNKNAIVETKPKVPVKTLQQRELEYAQARLRILGSAQSPEESFSATENITNNVNGITKPMYLSNSTTPLVTASVNTSPLSNGYQLKHQPHHQQQQQQQQNDRFFVYGNNSNSTSITVATTTAQTNYATSTTATRVNNNTNSKFFNNSQISNFNNAQTPTNTIKTLYNNSATPQVPDGILRLPKGPDGSTGFTVRR